MLSRDYMVASLPVWLMCFCFVLMWPKAVGSRPASLFVEEATACLEPRLQAPSQIHAHQRFVQAGTMGQVPREEVRLRQTSIFSSKGHSEGQSKGWRALTRPGTQITSRFSALGPPPAKPTPTQDVAAANDHNFRIPGSVPSPVAAILLPTPTKPECLMM